MRSSRFGRADKGKEKAPRFLIEDEGLFLKLLNRPKSVRQLLVKQLLVKQPLVRHRWQIVIVRVAHDGFHFSRCDFAEGGDDHAVLALY